jgi:hypoxanthine-DNA glycosylase
VVGTSSRVLVLGTLPGEESLRRRQYYAHPRNLFWPVVFGLFGAIPPPAAYEERLRFVIERGIALWDVCGSAERIASADTAIRAEMPNAIAELLHAHPAIRAVAFNGSTARRLYDRHFTRRPDLVYLALPSTSPAHARLGLTEKLAQWSALRQVLGGSQDEIR